jgi:MFS transporter, FSR family, fosmidomycin resistance protein
MQRPAGPIDPEPQHAHDAPRSLAGACLAHLLHDGYTDVLYPLLPIWQAEFGLSYAAGLRNC